MREEKLRIISVFDPAIDHARVPDAVWPQYNMTRNVALLEPYVIPGKRPTYYHIKEIPRGVYFRYVSDAPSGSALEAMRAFMVAVTMVENLEQAGGDYINWEPPRDSGYETMREDSLDRLRPLEIHDIGEVAKQHSDFRLSTEGSFHLGLSLVVLWGAFHVHRVAVSQSLRASSNDAASSVAASTPLATVPT